MGTKGNFLHLSQLTVDIVHLHHAFIAAKKCMFDQMTKMYRLTNLTHKINHHRDNFQERKKELLISWKQNPQN